MHKTQSIENKKGEVVFRKKLALQFEGKSSLYPGEPTETEYKSIIINRIRDYMGYFEYLKKQNIPLGPYLELGGGVGQGAMLLENKFGVSGFTCDISYETLRLGDKYIKHLDYKKMPIRICTDIYNLPFKSQSIPFIFTFQTLHHLPDPKPVFEEVKRVLTPGGYFYFNEEPIAQIFNLNLWRRDRNLKWFEKILKLFVVLHFISRIGKSETEHNILEETFSLNVWEGTLNIFPKVKVTIKVFPFGPTITLEKTNKTGWIKPPFLKLILLKVLGGGIEVLCQKEGMLKPASPSLAESRRARGEQVQHDKLYELLACPNCANKPQIKLNNNQILSCSTCLTEYKKTNGIFTLLSNDQKKALYEK